MNEENTFLEELEDVLEETASAEAEERTPTEDVAFWLKDLSNCASFRGISYPWTAPRPMS